MTIIKDDELISILTGNNSLISATVEGFEIFKSDYDLNIDVHIKLLYSKTNPHLILKFKQVLEYSFFHSSDQDFYYIESYKLFKSDKGFYLSLDPFDETENIHLQDQDYIIAKSIEGQLSF